MDKNRLGLEFSDEGELKLPTALRHKVEILLKEFKQDLNYTEKLLFVKKVKEKMQEVNDEVVEKSKREKEWNNAKDLED